MQFMKQDPKAGGLYKDKGFESFGTASHV